MRSKCDTHEPIRGHSPTSVPVNGRRDAIDEEPRELNWRTPGIGVACISSINERASVPAQLGPLKWPKPRTGVHLGSHCISHLCERAVSCHICASRPSHKYTWTYKCRPGININPKLFLFFFSRQTSPRHEVYCNCHSIRTGHTFGRLFTITVIYKYVRSQFEIKRSNSVICRQLNV